MPKQQALLFPTPFAPLAPFADASAWTDAGNASMQSWLERQRSLWQPWWDLQAQWLQPWLAAWPALAGWSAVPVRGTEQLA
jgi:hypothetical protein